MLRPLRGRLVFLSVHWACGPARPLACGGQAASWPLAARLLSCRLQADRLAAGAFHVSTNQLSPPPSSGANSIIEPQANTSGGQLVSMQVSS